MVAHGGHAPSVGRGRFQIWPEFLFWTCWAAVICQNIVSASECVVTYPKKEKNKRKIIESRLRYKSRTELLALGRFERAFSRTTGLGQWLRTHHCGQIAVTSWRYSAEYSCTPDKTEILDNHRLLHTHMNSHTWTHTHTHELTHTHTHTLLSVTAQCVVFWVWCFCVIPY